jgi:hypothetical protein
VHSKLPAVMQADLPAAMMMGSDEGVPYCHMLLHNPSTAMQSPAALNPVHLPAVQAAACSAPGTGTGA